MNKHRFRLIFSKTLGFLIPVAEINNAQRKPGQTRGPSNAAQSSSTPFSATLKALPLALLSCFSYSTYAEVITEPGQRASMTQSSSGVPVLEINDPNNKGLSHNRFEEFNVNKPGLIFNNSLRDGTSQIGGFVVHNPNLTHEAKAILAEVSGTHPSTLSGILEVFGGKADVLIAKITKEQSGIDANSMDFHVKGDQTLTGAHIVNTSGKGSYQVDGKTTANTLKDTRDKDGGYGGGGGGMSKTGLPTVTIEAGRVDQVKYEADQKSTVSLGGMTMNVAGGVTGDLNRDADKQTVVKKNENTAGTDIKFEISIPQWKKNNKVSPEADVPSRSPSNAELANHVHDQSVDVPSSRPSTPGSDGPSTRPSTPDADGPSTRPSTPDADGPGTSRPKPDVDGPTVSKPKPKPDVDGPSTSKPKPDVDTPTASKPKPSVDTPSASKPVNDVPDGPTATKPVEVTEASNVTSNKPAADTPAADGGGKLKDSNARHMTEATTGKDLKNALAKLNSPDRADQAALKKNPVTVEVRGPDGKIVPHTISNAADLKGLHGMQVVTGEQAEGVNPGSGLGQASNLYIKVVEHPGGGFTYSFTSSKPKPMPSQMPKVN